MSDVPEVFEQRDVRQAFESAGEGPWTVLYESAKDGDLDVLRWSLLAPTRLRQDILAGDGHLPSLNFGAPGFSYMYDGGSITQIEYERAHPDGYEPLVILQDHYGLRPPMKPQLSEEFRLYHNLWADDTGTEFVKVNDDGSEEPAAEIGPTSVRVRTKFIRQFQAGKQLDLVLRISSHQYVDGPDGAIQPGDIAVPAGRDDMSLSIRMSDAWGRQRPCSVLDGLKILEAPPQERAGIPPFDAREAETYHEFIIGEDVDGEPVRHTCDPDQLANYFGKNPDAPHFLTPVYFRREVLKRYQDQPRKYSITDGYLSCGALWGLQLDNNHPDHVMVFLGDLGEELPESERTYWQTFNIAPTGGPSETLFRRAFLGQWANPQAPDLRFKSAYGRFNSKWQEQFGWPLFKEPEPNDAHVLQRLRVPLDDGQPEFESQVMGLAKVLVDALNEKAIQEQLPNKVQDEKGIDKLERWMRQEQHPSADAAIAFLRRLQRLRSKLTAHRKGSDYEQVLADANVNPDPIQEVVTMLFGAELLMHDLASHFGIDLDSS